MKSAILPVPGGPSLLPAPVSLRPPSPVWGRASRSEALAAQGEGALAVAGPAAEATRARNGGAGGTGGGKGCWGQSGACAC